MSFRMNTVTRLVACMGILLVAATLNVLAEAEWPKRDVAVATETKAGLKTWAVISSARVQKAGLADLLTAALSREKGIKLVERDRLQLVAKELALSKMLGPSDIGRRAGAGRILKADALILLIDEIKDGKSFVKLVISDCRWGARLRVDYLPFVPEKIEPLAGKLLGLINETRNRFPEGIKHVFGVPHFVSRNLVHDYDHLQAGFAHLLGNVLASIPGVAVIETEEAHRIRREINLTDGADVERVVPLFIEGEFKVLRPAKAKEASVTLSLKITDGAKTVKTMSPKMMKLSAAAAFLRKDVLRQILQIRKIHAKSLSVDEQFAALVSRADTFARLGFWKDSTGLREAGLLLKPDATEQRIVTIKETCRIVTASWPRGTVFGTGREAFERVCRPRLTRRRRALEHVTYLIRNRQVSRSVATRLVRETMRSISQIRGTWSRMLGKEEQRKKEFLANVYPLILDLAAASEEKDSGRVGWQTVLIELALLRWDGNFLKKDDLDFLCKMLTKVVPDDLPPSYRVVELLHTVPYHLKHGDTYKHHRFSLEEYLGFLSRLKQSGRPMAVIYARYGHLNYEWVNNKDKGDKAELKRLLKETDQTLADVRRLLAKCEALGPKPSIRRNIHLCVRLGEMRSGIRERLNPSKPFGPTTGTPGPKRSTGRLIFEEVPLRLKRLSGEVGRFKGVRWRAPYGWGGVQYLQKCGDRLNVLWQNGAILFMRKKGLVEEIFVDRRPWFCDVQWDGRNIWIGTRNDGVWVVSSAGELLAKIGKKQGLPPADQGILLHPIAPGKVCAIGSFGQHRRAWCAIVEFDGKAGNVKIFHRATHVPASGEDAEKLASDINLVFQPSWIHQFDTGEEDKRRVLLVGRYAPCLAGRRRPLSIDLKTLRVSVFQHNLRHADHMSSQSYFSRDERLLEASRVLPHGGWVYVPGLAWFRINPQTWESERLNAGRLPYKYSILSHHAVAAHYGLVAWDLEGTFYSIRVKAVSSASQPTSKNASEKQWIGRPYRVIVTKQHASQSSKD